MSDKIFKLYADTETTGLDPVKNGIWQIAGIIEVDGVTRDKFDFKFAPMNDEVIDSVALEMSGFKSEAELRALPNSSFDGFKAFKAILEKHVDKFNRNQKFTLYGYNIHFDDNFIRAWFKKHYESYYGSYISPYKVDIYTITAMLRNMGFLPTANLKLETVCQYLGIHIDAHEAFSDIVATRELSHYFERLLMDSKYNFKEWIEICRAKDEEKTSQ